MKKGFWLLILLACLIEPRLVVAADAPVVVTPTAPAPAPHDVVNLIDRSIIYGEVVEMAVGVLYIMTAASPDNAVKVKWESVAKLAVNHPLPFHLKDGSIIAGTATEGPNGTVDIRAEPLKGTVSVPLDSITSVNPLVQPPVIYTGTLQGGYSQASGNSHLRNASLIGEFTGRSESLRLTTLGRYIYGDDSGHLLVRNSRGTIKLDFFITKHLYWFASSYFEQDTFQDLKLRTALSSGPGYQFIDRGDYESPWLKGMTLYAEAGAAYFNEDFNNAPDKTTFRARWAIKWNWPFLDDKINVYHFQEGFRPCRTPRTITSPQTRAFGSRSSQDLSAVSSGLSAITADQPPAPRIQTISI